MQVHASDELARLDAFGDAFRLSADAIARGEVSALEATEAAIARAEALNPQLNALVVTDFERARAHAAAPGGGVFAGVPTVVKDNENVFGLPTRSGSRATPATAAAADSPFVTEYRSTGVVIIGKSTLPAFGFSASTEFDDAPPTRNPWNLDFSTGASSGGSAALVAAGVVPIAHANDGGGSIRIPAACCGLVGLKATRGRIVDPIESASLPVNILANGVVSRSVRDTAAFVEAAEAFRPPVGMPAVGHVEGPNDRRLRIGLILDSVNGTQTDDETRAAVTETARLLEKLGHDVVEVETPVDARFIADFSHFWSLLAFSMRRFGRRLQGPEFDATQLDQLTLFLAAHTTPRLGYLSADAGFPEMFERLQRYVAFTPLHNASGAPGISVPGGLTREGLPIGVHLSAKLGQDRTLLELAYELEAARPFPSLLA